jgi:hypothetical protein
MVQIPVIVKNTTLNALAEHTTGQSLAAIPVNESESIVVLDEDVLRTLLAQARPTDKRLDDVILRHAL